MLDGQGLKANLNRLFNTLTEESILECKAASRYPKLLYALAFYHSVLLERRKFRTLGFNNFYDFNDTDFKVKLAPGNLDLPSDDANVQTAFEASTV